MNIDVESGRILLNISSSLNEFQISSSEIVYEYFMIIAQYEEILINGIRIHVEKLHK